MTIQFAPAPAGPIEPVERAESRFWAGFAVGVCAATVVGALTATGFLLDARISAPPLFTIDGTITLVGGSTPSSTPGFECEGDHGYDDISSGAAVRVSDKTGTLLAEGSLTGSVHGGDFCTFYFTAPDVPRGASFYDIAVSHRGSVSYDEAEADSGVHLTLGR